MSSARGAVHLFGQILIYCGNAWAQDYKLDPRTSKAIPTFQGTVLILKGDVRRFDKDHPDGIFLKKGERLFVKDRIETAPKSMIKFQLTDQTIIALGPDSIFKITEYDFQEINKRKGVFELAKGQLRAVIYQKAGPQDLEFKTKSISMGVRGTEFLANEFEQTEVALLSGKLLMTDLQDKKSQELQAAHYYIQKENQSKVYPIVSAELERLKAAHVKEEEDFRPFLERQKIEYPQATKVQEVDSRNVLSQESVTEIKDEDQWKRVLEQLNIRLKENHLLER